MTNSFWESTLRMGRQHGGIPRRHVHQQLLEVVGALLAGVELGEAVEEGYGVLLVLLRWVFRVVGGDGVELRIRVGRGEIPASRSVCRGDDGREGTRSRSGCWDRRP